MGLITLYLRREPTTDAVLLRECPAIRKRDVVAYRDEQATEVKARWPWYYRSKPDRRPKQRILSNLTSVEDIC